MSNEAKGRKSTVLSCECAHGNPVTEGDSTTDRTGTTFAMIVTGSEEDPQRKVQALKVNAFFPGSRANNRLNRHGNAQTANLVLQKMCVECQANAETTELLDRIPAPRVANVGPNMISPSTRKSS